MNGPSRLGKYLLFEQLHQGAIAELFLARAPGLPGAQPLVALKRLLPSVSADEEFVSLFVDEARIAAQLSHGNIAHVLEVGSEDDTYFIAMEYVSGRSLQALLHSPMVGGRPMPVEQAAYIACELCEGLDYAHRKRDFQGRELGIVHRGVSPANVLISYDGAIKLIDFGMAKAASSSHLTRAGSLKGKFGYMSPEQMKGEPLDRRSDLFSVGVLLYEMLTGVNPFADASDLEAMRRVSEADFPPPRSLNPDLPEALEAVLLKAMARDPADRYAWTSDLQQALLPFTVADDVSFSGQQLGEAMMTFFGVDAERDAERLKQAAEYQDPASGKRPSRAGVPAVSSRAPTPPAVPVASMLPFDVEDEELDASDRTQIVMAPSFDAPPSPPSPEPVRRSGTKSALPAQRGTGSHPAIQRPSGPKPAGRRPTGSQPSIKRPTGSHPAIQVPPEAVAAQEAPLGGGEPEEVTRPGFLMTPEVLAPPAAATTPAPTAAPAAASAPRANRSRLWMIASAAALVLILAVAFVATRHGAPPLSTVRVQVVPAEKAQVTIGGRLVEIGKSTQLPPGQYDLVAVAPGFKQHLQRIAVFANEPEAVFTVLLEPDAKPVTAAAAPKPAASEPDKVFTARFVSVDPGVEILVEGKPVGRTPDAQITLPVGSAYRFTARREGYEETRGLFGSSGEPTVTVTVALKKSEPKPAVAHHKASPKPARAVAGKGGLVCSTHPAGAQIEVDGKPTGATTPIYPDDPLMLPVGKHRVVFRLDGKKSPPRSVTIEKDKLVFLKDIALQGGEKASSGDLDSPEMMAP